MICFNCCTKHRLWDSSSEISSPSQSQPPGGFAVVAFFSSLILLLVFLSVSKRVSGAVPPPTGLEWTSVWNNWYILWTNVRGLKYFTRYFQPLLSEDFFETFQYGLKYETWWGRGGYVDHATAILQTLVFPVFYFFPFIIDRFGVGVCVTGVLDIYGNMEQIASRIEPIVK